MSNEVFDPQVYSAMQTGSPYATYTKTVLSKLYVTVLSPFSRQPEGVLLKGDGKKNDNDAFIETWTEMEDAFFRRTNKRLFDKGFLIKVEREKKEEVHTIEQYTDDELRPILSQKYLKFLKTIGELTSEVVLGRLLELAVEMDKSERITSKIEGRLAELQLLPKNEKVNISL